MKKCAVFLAIMIGASLAGEVLAQQRPRSQQRSGSARPRSSARSQTGARSQSNRSSSAQRSYGLPRGSSRSSARQRTQRSTGATGATQTPRRDFSYPRSTPRSSATARPRTGTPRISGGSVGRQATPGVTRDRVTTPGRTRDRVTTPGTARDRVTTPRQSTRTPGALGMSGSRSRRDATGRTTTQRPFLNLDRSDLRRNFSNLQRSDRSRARGSVQDRSRIRDDRRGRYSQRNWTHDSRRDWARGVRQRIRPYHYFRPGWRPYRHRWVDPRWSRWGSYWGWGGWRPYYWWRQPTWVDLTGFIVGGLLNHDRYVPYDYGENVIVRDNFVYLNGQQLAPVDVYATQAIQLGSVEVPVPPPPAETFTDPGVVASDWTPLGVFAVAIDENVDPNSFLQLAVSKQGFIGGTYYNQLTDQLLPIEGSVDPNTQRAAWRIGDNKDTVMEAGLYNLTQEQAPVLIHFGTERTESYLLVRLEEPAEGEVTASPDADFWN